MKEYKAIVNALMGIRFMGYLGCQRRQLTASLFTFLMINSALISVEYLHSSVFRSQGCLSQNRMRQQPDITCFRNSKTKFNFFRPTRFRNFFTVSRALRMGSVNDGASNNSTPPINSALAGLCIIPPEGLWPAIQSIRKVHDKRFRQWFPNMPLIFPLFRSSPITNELLSEAAETMAPALARFSPFQVPPPPMPFLPTGPYSALPPRCALARGRAGDDGPHGGGVPPQPLVHLARRAPQRRPRRPPGRPLLHPSLAQAPLLLLPARGPGAAVAAGRPA
jgi:hypothetical protein